MLVYGFTLIIIGVIILNNPLIISYLIGGLLVFFGIHLLIIKFLLSKNLGKDKSYFKFGKYKIYKD